MRLTKSRGATQSWRSATTTDFKIDNKHGTTTRGALLFRNSWGPSWGDKGYGWLPYEYVLRGLAIDWWVLLEEKWVNTGEFGI